MMAILISVTFFALQNKIYFVNQVAKSSNIAIKSVYVTGYSAGSKSYISYLNNLLDNTEINAVVVDVKGSDGYVTYNSSLSDVQKYKLTDFAISDIDNLVRFLHDKNIYVIGRIAVFEDPVYSKARPELAIYDKSKKIQSADGYPDLSSSVSWQDNHGLSWLDPASKEVWDYDISLAKDAFYHGFDEVNFDYVRFPSDGNTKNMGFPFWDGKKEKSEVIKEFFTYTRQQLSTEKISVDLFGETTINTDDMGIGQIIEDAFYNFDYISPMVYPSHYANGFQGFTNPAERPYEVIKYSMDSALAREKAYYNKLLTENQPTFAKASADKTKFRPWLQDFNMGAIYDADMVGQEIKATQDSLGNNFVGFMLWNPSNIYTIERKRQGYEVKK
ncbi:MAG: hypothetical protein NT094_05195 [Candidatus Staskawiczbacteria bacterium]|nr:hypothetical protein [Candidatus Staskawiczbacteria bacterium]